LAPVIAHFCATCAAQFPPSESPPSACPICRDERQYVGHGGQRFVTPDELGAAHAARIEEVEPGLLGIGTEPPFAIGQRALLAGRLLWDCIPLVDDAIAAAVAGHGGVDVIAVSHPHYYSGIVEWADRFDARILLHAADRQWVTRSSPRIEFWEGDRLRVSDEAELVRLGGHFPGGSVCLWRGALLSGDIVYVASDRDWVSFMYSYPNLIPLSAVDVGRMAGVLAGLEFDRVYGAWWHSVLAGDARAKVARSADRYIAAVTGRRE
jgi:hypothetical protein